MNGVQTTDILTLIIRENIWNISCTILVITLYALATTVIIAFIVWNRSKRKNNDKLIKKETFKYGDLQMEYEYDENEYVKQLAAEYVILSRDNKDLKGEINRLERQKFQLKISAIFVFIVLMFWLFIIQSFEKIKRPLHNFTKKPPE